MANHEAEPKSRWWRKLITVPGVIATAVLTALVGAGVTWMVNYLQNVNFHPSDAIKLSVETDPAKMSGVSSAGRSAIIPSSVSTSGTPGSGGVVVSTRGWTRTMESTPVRQLCKLLPKARPTSPS